MLERQHSRSNLMHKNSCVKSRARSGIGTHGHSSRGLQKQTSVSILNHVTPSRALCTDPANSVHGGRSSHCALQKQKSISILNYATPSRCLGPDPNGNDDNNNNRSERVKNRVKHLLLKHSKFGFIRNFLYFDTNNNRLQSITEDSPVSDSDQLVSRTLPELDLTSDPEIASKIINKDDFELGGLLGAGGFGSVYMGSFKGEEVAVKVMHRLARNPEAQLESFRAELHALKFSHPYIIQVLAATHIDRYNEGSWVVMEFVGHNNLLNIINDPTETLDADRRMKYSIQIASALSYAHKNRVAHLDLKPANILISPDDNCKLGDFGCSQKCEFDTGVVSPRGRSNLTGTFAYRAPELLRGEPPTFKADIYSYGVTMWQMRSRETPFGNQNHHVVIFGVVANGLRPPNPDTSESDPFELSYRDLYAQCWDACPLDRPSAQDLMELLTIWKKHL